MVSAGRCAVVLGVACGLVGSVPAAAYQRPPEAHGGFVTIRNARVDAARLGAKVAFHDEASSFAVTVCRHVRSSAVDCRVRLRFVDEDGTVGYVRYVTHTIATRGGRWSEIVPV